MGSHSEVILAFDGGVRNGITAIGYLATPPGYPEEILFSGNRLAGEGTSNLAEYRALIAGLKACLSEGVRKIHVFGDSQLIVKQVASIFKVNNPKLQKCCNLAKKLLDQFDEYTITWIPREENKQADNLVNQAFRRGLEKKCSLKQQRKQRHKELRRRYTQ